MLDHEASAAGLRVQVLGQPCLRRCGQHRWRRSGFGTVVQCLDPKNESGLTPKTDKASCDQAAGGNCGYYVSFPTYVTPEEVSVSRSIALACSYWSCPTVVVVVICCSHATARALAIVDLPSPRRRRPATSATATRTAHRAGRGRGQVRPRPAVQPPQRTNAHGQAYCLNNCGGYDNPAYVPGSFRQVDRPRSLLKRDVSSKFDKLMA